MAKQSEAVGKARHSSARWHEVGEAVLKEASEKLQAALKKYKDFKEGSAAQAIIEAAHRNIGSEDRVAVDK